VVPRLGDHGWDNTVVHLPAGRWMDVLTGLDHGGGRRRVGPMFSLFPVAILARSR
jgi:maltooligosyltrehalose synthase